MNMLVDGEWRTDTYRLTDNSGAFTRQTTTFRDWIVGSDLPDHVDAEPNPRFEPEPDRYHLYVSYACPWAHRTLFARALLGLEDTISVSVVDPFRGEDGWQFTPDKDGCTVDHIHDSDYLREIYVAADPDVTCRVTVPVLWDKKEETIVNNESREILRMLTTAFEEYRTQDVDLVPEGMKSDVDEIITEIYEPINNGVYRAGFASEQEPYDEAVTELFEALDYWDEVLAEQRFLVGDQLTEADVCMFTTLIRFDHVYHTHFMCNKQFVHQYEHLWPYLRDLYQLPGVADTVRIDHIKEHYYTTHPEVTPNRIVAAGPDIDFTTDHDRDHLASLPEQLR